MKSVPTTAIENPHPDSPPTMISIREAQPADAGRISALYLQLVNNPAVTVLPERLAELREDAKTALFVAEEGGDVRATALVSLCADAMFGRQPFAVVENVVVDAQCRSRGIGTRLFTHIEAFCLARDCSKIMLMSSLHRQDAHRFFERSGFIGSTKRGFVKYRSAFARPDSDHPANACLPHRQF